MPWVCVRPCLGAINEINNDKLLAPPSSFTLDVAGALCWRFHKITLEVLQYTACFTASRPNAAVPAAGVDDLLDNTQRALGLSLDRGEAAALISMLDANGDSCIQCEELEVRE